MSDAQRYSNQQSVKKESPATPQLKHTIHSLRFLTIRPDDPPELKRQKKLTYLDSSQLEKLTEKLEVEKKQ